MPTKIAEPTSARERLLAAADELFFTEGIHTVGIDRVIEHAGVAKATLYSTFGSKDELIRAYLLRRHDARRERMTARLARYDTPRDRLLGVFDGLGDLAAESNHRGCAFLNASAETKPGSSVEQVSSESRAWLRALLEQLSIDAGIRADEAGAFAQQLVLLYDGATVASKMDRCATAAAAARRTAATLLDVHLSA